MNVSIITVVYNNIEYIKCAIESVLSQDFPFIEHVIIDGGSTDGTMDMIEELRGKAHVILSQSDHGIYDAMNKGLNLASGDIVGFLHSDDILASTNAIRRIASEFSSKDIDAVYGDLVYVRATNIDSIVRYWKAGDFAPEKLKCGWMPPHPTLYVRRELLQQLGGFDCTYEIAADYDFILRLLSMENIQIKYLPETLVKMRTGGTSNKNLANIILKSREDYRALKSNEVGGLMALLWKNVSKLPQFLGY